MATTGKFGPAKVLFKVDGYNMLAKQAVKGLNHKIESITEQVDGLGDSAEAHSPIGKARLMLSQSGGFFDTTSGGPHALLASGLATSPSSSVRVACCGFTGDVIGQSFYGHEGEFVMAYEVLSQTNGLTKANVEYKVSGQVDKGVILQHATAKTADWNTKTDGNQQDYTADPSQRVIPITSATKASPCVVTTTVPHGLTTGDLILTSGNTLSGPSINSQQAVTVISTTTFSVAVNTSASSGAGTGGTFVRANSTAGAVGYMHVQAFSGFSGVVLKIRDSADDSTYADLITFATVSAIGAERQAVSGVIDRYTCVDGDVTGSGSITPWVGLARL